MPSVFSVLKAFGVPRELLATNAHARSRLLSGREEKSSRLANLEREGQHPAGITFLSKAVSSPQERNQAKHTAARLRTATKPRSNFSRKIEPDRSRHRSMTAARTPPFLQGKDGFETKKNRESTPPKPAQDPPPCRPSACLARPCPCPPSWPPSVKKRWHRNPRNGSRTCRQTRTQCRTRPPAEPRTPAALRERRRRSVAVPCKSDATTSGTDAATKEGFGESKTATATSRCCFPRRRTLSVASPSSACKSFARSRSWCRPSDRRS